MGAGIALLLSGAIFCSSPIGFHPHVCHLMVTKGLLPKISGPLKQPPHQEGDTCVKKQTAPGLSQKSQQNFSVLLDRTVLWLPLLTFTLRESRGQQVEKDYPDRIGSIKAHLLSLEKALSLLRIANFAICNVLRTLKTYV